MSTPAPRLLCTLVAAVLLAGCGDPPATEEAPHAASPAPAATDWSACRLPGVARPLPGRLFVVDGGPPPADAEPGRETIRRVNVLVPGTVSLLLTAPDATVWHLQVSPQTQVLAVFAGGNAPQRISGSGLDDAVRFESLATSPTTCGGYLLANGAGPALQEASEQVFGRQYDALYGLQAGQVVIGDPETAPLDTSAAPPSG